MLGGWLKRRIQVETYKSQKIDIERYIDGLRGMTDDEAGAALALATVVRLQLEDIGLMPRVTWSEHAPASEIAVIPLKIGSLIRECQKHNKNPQAAALMVWLHSTRTILQPDLRVYGQQMWRELRRGQYTAQDALLSLPFLGIEVPSNAASELNFMPDALRR